MKNYMLIAAIAIVAVAATSGAYLYYLDQTKASYVVMIDVTDSLPSNIDTSEVIKHIEHQGADWSETGIRFTTFSNFQNNKVTMLTIPPQFPLLGNPEQRSGQLQDSYRQMLDTLYSIIANDTGRPQSVIYTPMVQQLNWLAASDAHFKEAFFYSDCQENTVTFSVYKSTDRDKVINNPDSVKAYFETLRQIQSLKGVTVYFIYNAPTPLAENRFILMANLWGGIFKAHGATVVIGPNLSTN